MDLALFILQFNNTVNEIDTVVRSSRHTDCSERVINVINNISTLMHDINFQMSFEKNPEKYVKNKMLDIMDYIKDNWLDNGPLSKHPEMYGYRIIKSIYDTIKEFYFYTY